MLLGPFSVHLRKPIKKLGAFCWLALAIAIVETLICIKFGRGMFFVFKYLLNLRLSAYTCWTT